MAGGTDRGSDDVVGVALMRSFSARRRPFLDGARGVVVRDDRRCIRLSGIPRYPISMACRRGGWTEVAVVTAFNSTPFSHSMTFASDSGSFGIRPFSERTVRATTSDDALAPADGAGRSPEDVRCDHVVADVPDSEHSPYDFGVGNPEPVPMGGEVRSRA